MSHILISRLCPRRWLQSLGDLLYYIPKDNKWASMDFIFFLGRYVSIVFEVFFYRFRCVFRQSIKDGRFVLFCSGIMNRYFTEMGGNKIRWSIRCGNFTLQCLMSRKWSFWCIFAKVLKKRLSLLGNWNVIDYVLDSNICWV